MTCRGWHYRPQTDELTAERGAPCVVLAHGFAGTRAAGLEPYAERFAAEGMHALVFDYRHFGASDGHPRQLLSITRQQADWRAATAAARSLQGVDPSRVALWGTSFSGGHVIEAAVRDGSVAAVISQGPHVDGIATVLQLLRYAGPVAVLRLTGHGLLDALRGALGLDPHLVAAVAEPGELAAMTSPDAKPGYLRITPPGWRNEFAARIFLWLALWRPALLADRLPCPWLVQVVDDDQITPPGPAVKAAERAGPRAQLRRYPGGHFDIYVDELFARGSDDQVDFLRRTLAPAAAPAAGASGA